MTRRRLVPRENRKPWPQAWPTIVVYDTGEIEYRWDLKIEGPHFLPKEEADQNVRDAAKKLDPAVTEWMRRARAGEQA